MLGTLTAIFVIAAMAGAWFWCLRNPKTCLDWRGGKERRVVNQPLDFTCRREKQRREDKDNE